MPQQLKTILSIAGSDPTGGAGIQADIRAGNALGLHVLTAITSLTSQNSKGLKSNYIVPAKVLKQELKSITEDVAPDAVKIGLVGSVENLIAIAEFLKTLQKDTPVIIDPVLKITTQSEDQSFKTAELRELYLKRLFPIATVVTPNLEELDKLTGKKEITETTLNDLQTQAAVIKGGHDSKIVIEDILLTPEKKVVETHGRINCRNLHGTGCVYSTFMTSFMALGLTLEESFRKTSQKIYDIITKSCDYKLGESSYGPLNINENYII